jgi:hypothetical protein
MRVCLCEPREVINSKNLLLDPAQRGGRRNPCLFIEIASGLRSAESRSDDSFFFFYINPKDIINPSRVVLLKWDN